MEILNRIFKKRRQTFSVTELINKFLLGTITRRENNWLDKWVAESDQNMIVFEVMTEKEDVKEAEILTGIVHERKARRIAALLIKYLRKQITPDEDDELGEWVGASDKNAKLFNELTDHKRVNLALKLLNGS